MPMQEAAPIGRDTFRFVFLLNLAFHSRGLISSAFGQLNLHPRIFGVAEHVRRDGVENEVLEGLHLTA